MLALSLAQLRTQAHRLVATALAIVIAVGFVVATLVLNDTSKHTVFGALSSQYLTTDSVAEYDWTHGGESPTAEQMKKLGDRISGLPGVRAVTVDRSSYLNVRAADGDGYRVAQVQTLADGDLRWQKLESGVWPNGAGQVVAAPTGNLKVGSRVEFQTQAVYDDNGKKTAPERTVQATVVGLTDRSSGIGALGNQQFWAPADQVDAWGSAEVDAIRVEAAPGVGAADLTRTIRTDLDRTKAGQALTVRTGEAQSEAVADSLVQDGAELTTVLLLFAAVAVFVCALVIANTFAVLLAQRVRELALLRAIGAAGRQLRRGVLVESFVIGLVASAIGVVAGIGLATGVSALASQYDTPIPLSGVSVGLLPVLIGLALGTVVTMVAAFNPARKATKVAPLAAMRPMDEEPVTTRSGLFRRIAGLLLAVPGVAIAYYGGKENELLIAAVGGMVTFLAALLLARWLVPLAVAGVGRIVGPAGKVPGKLAALNATRNPQRTAATATALIIGVTLTTTMVVGAATTRASASAAIDDNYPTDVVVSSGQDTGAPATLVGTVAGVKNVAAAIPVLSATLQVGKLKDTFVQGVDPAKASTVVRSDKAGLIPTAGTIVLPEWFKTEVGAQEGKALTVRVGGRKMQLKAHLVPSDAVNNPRVTSADLNTLGVPAQIDQIWAQLADDLDNGERADTLDAISSAAADVDPGSVLSGSADERASFDQLLDILLLIVLGLLAVAVVIAIIGVGNTMALSVLERRKESGVLRALGLTRGQLRWMLLWEAMLIAGVAAAIGVVLGSTYGVLAVKSALGNAGTVHISIPPGQVLAILVVATVAGALASVLPSRRAAKISPVAAIASA